MSNSVIKQFLTYHEIDPEYLSSKVDTKVYTVSDFFGGIITTIVYKPQRIAEVSVADIYGCDDSVHKVKDNIFDSLELYYAEEPKKKKGFFQKKDVHNLRSNDRLLMGAERMVEEANNSPEKMTICRIDNANNINLVYTNGMHRFLALRALYLKQLSYHSEVNNLVRNRFKLKVLLNEIDEIKTFCLFIFKHYQHKKGVKVGYKLEYVNYNCTGRMKFATFKDNKVDEEFVFSDEELIEFIKPFIEADLEYYRSINIPGFKNFLTSIGYGVEDGVTMKLEGKQ